MLYYLGKVIFILLFKICFRIRAFGSKDFPKTGPVIIASNHTSFLDPIIVGISVHRQLYFLARQSLFKVKILGKILPLVNTLPLKREAVDVGAFKIALDKLKEGKVISIFPEGTRTKDGNLQKPRYGIGFLKEISGAKIVPCYIKGSREVLPRGARLPRFSKISVYIGRPLNFKLKDFNGTRKERYMKIAMETMEAIGELKKNAD